MAKKKRKLKRTSTHDTDILDKKSCLPVADFLAACHTGKRIETDGVVTLFNPLITRHIYIPEHGIDLFNCIYVKIEVEAAKNEIRIWRKLGPLVLDELGHRQRDSEGRDIRRDISHDVTVRGLLSA